MLLTYKDISNIKKIEKLIDSGDNEKKILDSIKEYRYKELDSKFMKKLLNHFIKDDEGYAHNYKYNSNLYKQKNFDSLMDFFTRKFKEDVYKDIQNKSKNYSMIIPNQCDIEALDELKNSKKILRLKQDCKDIIKDLKSFDIVINNYSYIDMKLLVSYYHRIHSPVNGIIKKLTPIEGKEDFFGKNSLWIVEIETEKSSVYFLLVGESDIQDFDFLVEKGDKVDIFDEIGFFNWGSQTVILYNPKDFEDILIKEKTTYFVGDGIFKKDKNS